MPCPHKKAITAYVTAEEFAAIGAAASRAHLTVSKYVAAVCRGGPVQTFERETFQKTLLGLRGDLGRLGGLFKMALRDWPANDPDKTDVRRVLRQTEALQARLQAAIDNA